MTDIVIAGAGSAAGSAFGDYAMAAFVLGTLAAQYIFAPDPQKFDGTKLTDIRVNNSAYGAVIPKVWGKVRVAGNIIWASKVREKKKTSTETAGKGGGGGTETVTYKYFVSLAVAFCDTPVKGLLKIWINQSLVYDSNRPARKNKLKASKYNFYTGSETQGKDPTMLAAEGDVPAHRGLCYIVFKDLDITNFGATIPNIMVELDVRRTTYELSTPNMFLETDSTIDTINYLNTNASKTYLADIGQTDTAFCAIDTYGNDTTSAYDLFYRENATVFAPKTVIGDNLVFHSILASTNRSTNPNMYLIRHYFTGTGAYAGRDVLKKITNLQSPSTVLSARKGLINISKIYNSETHYLETYVVNKDFAPNPSYPNNKTRLFGIIKPYSGTGLVTEYDIADPNFDDPDFYRSSYGMTDTNLQTPYLDFGYNGGGANRTFYFSQDIYGHIEYAQTKAVYSGGVLTSGIKEHVNNYSTVLHLFHNRTKTYKIVFLKLNFAYKPWRDYSEETYESDSPYINGGTVPRPGYMFDRNGDLYIDNPMLIKKLPGGQRKRYIVKVPIQSAWISDPANYTYGDAFTASAFPEDKTFEYTISGANIIEIDLLDGVTYNSYYNTTYVTGLMIQSGGGSFPWTNSAGYYFNRNDSVSDSTYLTPSHISDILNYEKGIVYTPGPPNGTDTNMDYLLDYFMGESYYTAIGFNYFTCVGGVFTPYNINLTGRYWKPEIPAGEDYSYYISQSYGDYDATVHSLHKQRVGNYYGVKDYLTYDYAKKYNSAVLSNPNLEFEAERLLQREPSQGTCFIVNNDDPDKPYLIAIPMLGGRSGKIKVFSDYYEERDFTLKMLIENIIWSVKPDMPIDFTYLEDRPVKGYMSAQQTSALALLEQVCKLYGVYIYESDHTLKVVSKSVK